MGRARFMHTPLSDYIIMLYELECVGWFIGAYSGAGTVTLLNAKTAVKIYIYSGIDLA